MMAADLHIHVFKGITEEDLAIFCSNHFGSKHFDLSRRVSSEKDREVHGKVAETPNVWIGEVSWLKAGLFDAAKTYIPGPVAKISELIGEDLPTLDDALTEKILATMDLPNTTSYSLNTKEKVGGFLKEHKGERLFTVSW